MDFVAHYINLNDDRSILSAPLISRNMNGFSEALRDGRIGGSLIEKQLIFFAH